MLSRNWLVTGLLLAFSAGAGYAQIFGSVRGKVGDPQQAAVMGAKVTLKSQASAWTRQTNTDAAGEFSIPAVPAGAYTVEIEFEGFQTISRVLGVTIGSAPMLHFSLELATVKSSVEVTAPPEVSNAEASSAPVTVSEQEILHTPGADRTSSLAFITDFVPGSFMLHDHLHLRGGHQVTWLVDGVPVPNTNISSNVARQMDPKDIQSVEISRGGYSARYGDRTYGMVNIITRSGFEFENEGELSASYGSFNQTNDQISFGGHGDKFAYYASASGNRTDLGLEPPTEYVLHNMGSGLSGFTSMTYNATAVDQFRLAASVRQDHYQIPNTFEDQALGIRDVDQERDSFVNLSWVRTFSPSVLLTVSPFYHYNRGKYLGGPNDPLITTNDRVSYYGGAQTTLSVVRGPHNLNLGLYGFSQHDDALFGLATGAISSTEQQPVSGGVGTAFVEEQFKPWTWLTVNGGVRLTHFSGGVNENAANPRIGGAIQIPRLRWVLRGFYGYYYQPPPLSTISGTLLSFAGLESDFGFLPLHGERDLQREFGLAIPFRGWTFEFSHFGTDASNFADHDVLGNSNISLPLTIEFVRVRGWEGTVRSPQVWRRARFHLAYSNQVVKGRGAVTGGLTDFLPPAAGYFYIDHDQRNTASAGGEVALPRRAWLSANVNYGSGFLDVNGPQHLPPHTSADVSLGKAFGERWSAGFSALNLTNSRYLLGRESAFAGTHYNNPREFIGQVRYRFHF